MEETKRSVAIPGLGRCYHPAYWIKPTRDGEKRFYENPKWYVEYGKHGKVYQESARTTDLNEAIKFLRKRVELLGQNRIGVREERIKFERLKDMLIRDYKVNKKRSLASAELSARHLGEFFSGYKAVDIKLENVLKYIEQRQGEGAANASINRELSALKRMFSLAHKGGDLVFKPYVPMLEENNVREGFVDHGGFLAIVNELPGYIRDVARFLYLTGLRIGAVRGLEHRHVDWEGGVIHLPFGLSKNKKGQVIPIRGELSALMERVKANRDPECPYLFHRDKRRIGDFRKAWQTACVTVGLGRFIEEKDEGGAGNKHRRGRKKYQGILVHDFRRTAVRNMVRAGVQEKVAMGLSGHKTRAVFDRYNIVNEDDLGEATEKLQAYLAEQSQTPKVVPLKQQGGQG